MSTKIDYELKSKILQLEDTEGILTIYNKYRRMEYAEVFGADCPSDYDTQTLTDLYAFHFAFNKEYLPECEKILKANRARSARLRKKILYLLTHYQYCTFCTLTFSDKYFTSTTSNSRRQAVTRFLNTLECPFIGNVDYGESFQREHYHVIVACRLPLERIQFYNNHYGNIDVQRIRCSGASALRLGKYVSKLANHAVKYTTKRSVLIYSRKYPIPSEAVALDLVRATSCVSNTTTKRSYKMSKLQVQRLSATFTAKCCTCGSIIADYEYNKHKYVLRRNSYGRDITQYFCEDCLRKYHVKSKF